MSNFDSRSFSIPQMDLTEVKFNDIKSESSLKDALVDLYLNVKVRNQDEVFL